MITIRGITLLIVCMFLAGCGLLEDCPILQPGAGEEPLSPPPIVIGEEPPALYILHGHEAIPMDQGSFCWGTAEGGVCADVAVFPPGYAANAYLPVIDRPLTLMFDAPFPDTVQASLWPENNETPKVPDDQVSATLDENGEVLVTVPDDVTGSYALLVFAKWTGDAPQGDSAYATPIRFEP